jgi:hypothetical protein
MRSSEKQKIVTKSEKTVAIGFVAKSEKTVATGFEAKPDKTILVVLRPNH